MTLACSLSFSCIACWYFFVKMATTPRTHLWPFLVLGRQGKKSRGGWPPFLVSLGLEPMETEYISYIRILILWSNPKTMSIRPRKQNLFYGRRDSKKRSVGRNNVYFIFLKHFLAKITPKKLKNHDFSCSLRSQFLIQFLSKKQLILPFKKK